MLIVWGFTTTTKLLGILTFVCGKCGNPAAHRVTRLVRKFTLFWIPLFPVRQRTVITCTFCGVAQVVPKDQLPALTAALQSSTQPGTPTTGPVPAGPGADPFAAGGMQHSPNQFPGAGGPPSR